MTSLQARAVFLANKPIGRVNRWLFGNNMLGYQKGGWPHAEPIYHDRGAGIWDPERKRPVPEMIALAKNSGLSVARYPGGCGVHAPRRAVGKRCVSGGVHGQRGRELLSCASGASCEAKHTLPVSLPLQVEVEVQGLCPRSATRCMLNGERVDSTNEQNPEAVSVTSRILSKTGSRLTVELPPHSLSALHIE